MQLKTVHWETRWDGRIIGKSKFAKLYTRKGKKKKKGQYP